MQIAVVTVAVFADVKERADFFTVDGPLRVDPRLSPACPIIATENYDFLIRLTLSEHGIHEEDWRLKLFVGRIDRFHALSVHVERFDARHFRKHFFLLGSFSLTICLEYELVTCTIARLCDFIGISR